jgi:hypothetical protein
MGEMEYAATEEEAVKEAERAGEEEAALHQAILLLPRSEEKRVISFGLYGR